ncbi:MAG: EFR1 family ferrodoxin [Eubacterium sp.]
MILCFSGTGNSAYAAKIISKVTNENILSINNYIKTEKSYDADKNERFIFVTPTYAWRIPKIVESWIKTIKQNGRHKAYFIMTCGGEIGNAEKYLRALCEKINIEFLGCAGIIMPENYIAMFDAPDEKEAIKIIEKAQPRINKIAQLIKDNKPLEETGVSITGKIYSSVVNAIFYPLFVHAGKFYATSSCIGCGKCEQLCPLNNISLPNGIPVWQDNCTHCMACICHCPVNAVEYGTKSKGKPRYTCPM